MSSTQDPDQEAPRDTSSWDTQLDSGELCPQCGEPRGACACGWEGWGQDPDQEAPQEAQEPHTYNWGALEQAMGLWRDGWKQTQRLTLPEDWRQEYELAATAVSIAALHQCQTMQDLLRWYFNSDRERQVDPAIRGAVDQATQDSGHILNWGIVEDAAFWLRYCSLVGRAVREDEEGQQQGQ